MMTRVITSPTTIQRHSDRADGVYSSAVMSKDGLYRYDLQRCWDDQRKTLCWVMLNPSTANSLADDPTIRRCMGFARDLGFGSILVRNLFAYRATSPAALVDAATYGGIDVVGPQNDMSLNLINPGDTVICAWGANPFAQARAGQVRYALRERVGELFCLGRTKSAAPRHPLYLPKTARLESY